MSGIKPSNVLHTTVGPKEGVDSVFLVGIPKPYNSDFLNVCAAVSPIEVTHVLRRVRSSACVLDHRGLEPQVKK
jgi:hypothetical protein